MVETFPLRFRGNLEKSKVGGGWGNIGKPDIGHWIAAVGEQLVKVKITRDIAGGAVEYKSLNDKTRVVFPGQKMNFKAEVEPANANVTAWEWKISGKTFKNYVADQKTATLTDIKQTDLDDQTVHFYWADAAKNREVQCRVKIGGHWYEGGKEVLHVIKPTYTISSTIGKTALTPSKRYMGLLPGIDPDTGTVSKRGIVFYFQLKIPEGYDRFYARWNAVQITKPAHYRTLKKDNKEEKYDMNGEWVLDKDFPYTPPPYDKHPGKAGTNMIIPNKPITVDDQPMVNFYPIPKVDALKYKIDKQRFIMTFMFLPVGEDTRLVPLVSIEWYWEGTANLGANGWTLTDSGEWKGKPKETTEHPTWTKNVDNADWIDIKK